MPGKDNYGFGLSMMAREGHRAIAHDGGINGFTSTLAFYPGDGLTVIVLNNAMGPTGDIASKLATLMFGKTVTLASERKEVAVDAKILARYVGRYELRPSIVLEITQEGNALMTQAPKQQKIAIFAENDTNFFARAIDAQITFLAEGEGPASALVLHQAGRDMTAKRIP